MKETQLFENVLNEASVLRGPSFIISSYSNKEQYKGSEAWRLKEYIATDEALGIGHENKISLRQLKDTIETLPEKLQAYLNETAEEGRHYTCKLDRIYDEMYGRSIIVQVDIACLYDATGHTSGGYQDFFIKIDYESLAETLSECLHV